jgi:hypothetical protein
MSLIAKLDGKSAVGSRVNSRVGVERTNVGGSRVG